MTEEKKSILEIQTAQAVLYDNEAEVFDDISAHEDPAGKLRSFLLESFDFDDKTVLEAGAGAGRITDYYVERAKNIVVTDAYDSMVTILRQKYANLKKVTAELCDHRQLRARFEGPYDIFISAFSFNYAFDQNVGDYDAFLEKIVLANLKAQSQAVSVELPFRLLLNNMETCQMENDLILLKPWQGIVVETENAFS